MVGGAGMSTGLDSGPSVGRLGLARTTEPLPCHMASRHSISSSVTQFLHGSSGLPKGKSGSSQAFLRHSPRVPFATFWWLKWVTVSALVLSGRKYTGHEYWKAISRESNRLMLSFFSTKTSISFYSFQLPVCLVVCLSLQISPSYPSTWRISYNGDHQRAYQEWKLLIPCSISCKLVLFLLLIY